MGVANHETRESKIRKILIERFDPHPYPSELERAILEVVEKECNDSFQNGVYAGQESASRH